MSKAFDKIMTGAQDALAYSEGNSFRGIVHVIEVVDVKAIRQKTGLSQAAFSKAYGIPKRTIENWEQGIRKPDAPALALLTIIDKNPDAAFKALHDN